MLKEAKDFLLDLVFPPLCLTCEKDISGSREVVCADCLNSAISGSGYAVCPMCSKRVVSERPDCHAMPYALLAAADYENPVVKKMIWQFKYEGWQSIAPPLASLLTKVLQKELLLLDKIIQPSIMPNWWLVPIPLHRSRQRKRGFNQSERLAELVSWQLSLPWMPNNLVRIKKTFSQAELSDFQERENNIKDAFMINDPGKLCGRNIILVDDVSTSGATLGEAARVLKLAGAKKIIGLVIANAASSKVNF